jgi:addiction module RelB/DinJ family antitoxin
MAQSAVIQVRVDREVKEEAEQLYEDLGLDLPSAIRIFLKKSIAECGLPFRLREKHEKSAPGFFSHPETITLSNSDFDYMVSKLNEPAPPNPRMTELFRKYGSKNAV